MNWTERILVVFYLGTIATIFALPGISSYADMPREGLVAVWLFEGGRGDTVEDVSRNGNDMAIAAGTSKWGRGKFGKAMEFDGVVDYLAAPDSPSLESIRGQAALSMVAWVKPTESIDSGHIVSRPRMYHLGVENNRLRVALCRGDEAKRNFIVSNTKGITEIKLEEWVHLALVYDGQELRGYVNCQVDIVRRMEGHIVRWVVLGLEPIPELRIGGDSNRLAGLCRWGYFAGYIDEVGLFKTALTESQIRQIMRRGLTGPRAVELKGKLATTWGAIKRTRQISGASSM